MSALKGLASGLVPEQCTIGNRPIWYPISEVGFTFDGAIAVAENTLATVYYGDQPVATGTLSCTNYAGAKRTQGSAVITFESPLVLPKGETYKLVVPGNAIYKENEPGVSNDEISVEFSVPATLGEADPSIEDGCTVEDARNIGFYFRTETAPVENSKVILLREGIPVREYDCQVSWDWDLGYAGVDFGERINFESGVRYSIKLPQGSVSALYRSDIVNEEAEVSFIGGYTEPIKPIQYVWCSLYDNRPSDVLGEVMFFYDQPIALAENPVVQLYLEDDDIVVKEVVPTLSEEDGKWVLVADFENVDLSEGKGYYIVIPEGTLVTKDGDVVINQRSSVYVVGNTNSISGLKAENCSISAGNGMITVNKMAEGSEISLFSLDGKLISHARPSAESVSLSVPDSGVYLLSINGKAYKIVVEK